MVAAGGETRWDEYDGAAAPQEAYIEDTTDKR